ncbi:tetratricopeptide repeat protein [Acetobacterium wieringae]|uniref:tetratricopeptide repeat protein n=1 Tax=Acetobacterium wieringae TaxID=52694 RepID=UPI0020341499|nr:tetratricopeptide repeat protein [Acetobacterium wieringae]URN83472.1 sel1 repeat family protein [Acetobacterium wieringae]
MEFISQIIIPILIAFSAGVFPNLIKEEKKKEKILFWVCLIGAISFYLVVNFNKSNLTMFGFSNSENPNTLIDESRVYRLRIFDYFRMYFNVIVIESVLIFLIIYSIKYAKRLYYIIFTFIFCCIFVLTYVSHDYETGVEYYNRYQETRSTENYLTLSEESLIKSYQSGYDKSALMLATINIEKYLLDDDREYLLDNAEKYLTISNELGFENKKAEAYFYYCGGYVDYKKWRKEKNNDQLFYAAEKKFVESQKLYSNDENDASFSLGYLYSEKWEEDKSDEQYFSKAETYLKDTLEQGDKRARYELGFIYREKWEEDKSDGQYFSKAETYLKDALEQGDIRACYQLGFIYREKWEEDKSDGQCFSKAETYLKDTLEQGDIRAYYDLGYLYTERWEDDKSNKQYFEDAKKYFKQALANGNINAENALEYLDKAGSIV